MTYALTILILGLSLTTLAQSGRYQINTADSYTAEGTITISPYSIVICQDSTETVLPVIDVGEDKRSVYYILKGCKDGIAFMGYGMLSPSSTENLGGGRTRYYSALYVEIRARQHYAATKYSIYHDK